MPVDDQQRVTTIGVFVVTLGQQDVGAEGDIATKQDWDDAWAEIRAG